MPDAKASKTAAAATTITTEKKEAPPSLLNRIVEEGRLGRDEQGKRRGRDLVSEFARQVLQGQMTVSPDLESTINKRIAQIDKLLSDQLDEILHHEKFQKLEATWRGIRYLIEQSETGVNLKIKVFNATDRKSVV